jgi:precorrin-6A synthase
MRTLLLIGMGVGNPEHITVQAIAALNRVDVFFVLDKGGAKADLTRLRKQICERYVTAPAYRVVEVADPVRDPSVPAYASRVEAWHEQRVSIFERMLSDELHENQCGAFLVWGDPSLYDSTLRIVERVLARGRIAFEYEVIPGISSVQALAASHRIALNRIGGAIHIVTGRQLAEGWPADSQDVVVMLDGDCTFKQVAGDDIDIYWGAYLGTPDEILVSGNLRERAPEIERLRGAAREKHGWIMDIYLLRRAARV